MVIAFSWKAFASGSKSVNLYSTHLIPLAAILITNLVHTVRLAKTIAKEEEEAAVKEAIQALRAEREQKK